MGNMYSSDELNQIRMALERQKAALLEAIRNGMTEREQLQYSAILGQSSGDSSDEALATSLGDLSAARLDLEIRQLRALDAAAVRLGSGDYGVCTECGNAIPLGRLVANPAAERCVGCQEAHERSHASQPHGSL
jgi:RNA polymerase-binding transcription factor DksA